ncbi:MAG: ABC transporter permease subunit [Paenibacillus macerans]|uniref:Binding--dependent transport system inner membrane component family protein n=3 Tax=Paenibacillus macerans TaxID=44252 RepID=A0A090ZH36_PAEMA|nr:ABC transporter permease subunit [Paenibacillus macerans]KFN09540.1 binding--dependent transport system inner membrane component family protein [Paenibacillus macerans]MCY7557914.1 ABC transporter permease subunit [Paenibacillus macerans]MDU7477464.1 ABC transporter permease subunit [Paenibacillus macerans]MEC0150966.1 ABC transporter permease subunit [Paenibacillus macerans]MEC0328277.1 ABC transporter permease subunit [Paenibacillus macerans]
MDIEQMTEQMAEPAAAPERNKPPSVWGKRWGRLYAQRHIQIMALLGVAWMIVFNYVPMYGIIIAFKEYNIVRSVAEAPWVGFDHFKEFFQDDNFVNVMKNTLGISLIKLIVGFPLPIIFALFLNEMRSVRFKKAVQTISYLPHFLSWVVLGGILTTWLSDVGIINDLLLALHLIQEPISYLAEPSYFWGIVVASDVWKELGWSAIIYLAAITSISPEMYEAATIDGAGRFQKMWYITLPSIKATISILFILAVGGVLNSNFDQILVLRNALNESASNVIDIYVYQTGMLSGRYSYSTAVGLFKSVIALILLLLANRVTKKLNDTSLF